MNTALIYIGAIIALAALFFIYVRFSAWIKAHALEKNKELFLLIQTLLGVVGVALGVTVLVYGKIHADGISMTPSDQILTYIGLFATICLAGLMVVAFVTRYYKLQISEQYKKIAFWTVISGIIPLILSFVIFMEGIDVLIDFPLTKGIEFNGRVIVAFYALFIIGGAGIVYFIAAHQLHLEGYRKDYIENLFYVAFPAGAIGSRIWYVIGQWSTEFATRPFWHVFAMWEGGLAIQGGAIFGTIAGVWFIKKYRKDINLWHLLDIAVPTILVAQAIGRWGNFTNQEIYGAVTNPSQWWFLPNFIIQQMTVAGQMRVPLFLIESLSNLAGYFIIRYAVGGLLKKWLVVGDLACVYPIWYGLTR
ncbi:MAG: prolipoprotein diacylglyceryl transferase, partial [Firmicutes bacterium]|nr:prolipoprotein diacylglyceryl transferase [Bacillota bacterium]